MSRVPVQALCSVTSRSRGYRCATSSMAASCQMSRMPGCREKRSRPTRKDGPIPIVFSPAAGWKVNGDATSPSPTGSVWNSSANWPHTGSSKPASAAMSPLPCSSARTIASAVKSPAVVATWPVDASSPVTVAPLTRRAPCFCAPSV